MATGWRNPRFDVQEESKVALEQAFSLSVALVVLLFLTYRSFDVQAYEGSGQTEIISIQQIPETEQLKRPPPPQRPQIPVATESDDIPEDVTIVDTELDLTLAPPPTPPPPNQGVSRTEESPVFVTWEEEPVLKKQVIPDYPRIAREAGVEGFVIVKVTIDEKGNVIAAEPVVASPAGVGFEEEAIKAIMKWKYEPARQRDVAIKVALAQRVDFVLKNIPPAK